MRSTKTLTLTKNENDDFTELVLKYKCKDKHQIMPPCNWLLHFRLEKFILEGCWNLNMNVLSRSENSGIISENRFNVKNPFKVMVWEEIILC